MISFKLFSPENSDKLTEDILAENKNADKELLLDVFSTLREEYEDEREVAVTASDGCLLVRLFTDEYIFPFPIALFDDADELLATDKLRAYAVREEIPLVICDIPRECLDAVTPIFKCVEITAEDEEKNYFTLRAISEAAALSEIPEAEDGDISLSTITDKESCEYARLCRDEETNKFWGYNYRDDCDNVPDTYFLDCARQEFARGVAISFAIKENGVLCGEAILYAFDLQGGCECAIRLLRKSQGVGIGTASLKLLIRTCKDIGILRLYATVMKDNSPSVKLFSSHFKKVEDSDDVIKFYLDLQM